jgi:hypothetical protein
VFRIKYHLNDISKLSVGSEVEVEVEFELANGTKSYKLSRMVWKTTTKLPAGDIALIKLVDDIKNVQPLQLPTANCIP